MTTIATRETADPGRLADQLASQLADPAVHLERADADAERAELADRHGDVERVDRVVGSRTGRRLLALQRPVLDPRRPGWQLALRAAGRCSRRGGGDLGLAPLLHHQHTVAGR